MQSQSNVKIILLTVLSTLVLVALISGGIFFLTQEKTSQPVHSTATAIQVAQPVSNTTAHQPMYGDGWYEGCPPKEFRCFTNLDQMANNGFRFVINYAQLKGSDREILAYANHANQKGIKIIWSLKDIISMDEAKFTVSYPDILQSCGCSTKMAVAEYVVNLVKDSPATLGYYIADEPKDPAKDTESIKQYDTVVQLGKSVRNADPNIEHFRLIMISNAVGHDSFETYAKAKVSDIIGEDFYPIGRPGRTIQETSELFAQLQFIASKYGQKTAITVQAHSLSQYTAYGCEGDLAKCPFPTKEEMTQERSLALQQPIALVVWYTYPKVRPNQEQWENAIAACSCKNK